jgi:hypothetical protein
MKMNEVDETLKQLGKEFPRTHEEAEELVCFLCGVIDSKNAELRQYDLSRKELREDFEEMRMRHIFTRAYLPIQVRPDVDAQIEAGVQDWKERDI